jgi:hypothetical protein
MCATVLTFSCDREIIALWDFHFGTKGIEFMRAANGTLNRTLRTMLLSLVIVGGISSGSALARTIIVEIAPPPARVEVVPEMRRGYTWAPGYWSWNRDRHVWVNGRTMRTRTGYAWAPDSWHDAGGRHEFRAGRWTRNPERGQ